MGRFGNKFAKVLATQTMKAISDYDKKGRKIRKQKGPGCLLAVLFFSLVFLLGISLVFAIVK